MTVLWAFSFPTYSPFPFPISQKHFVHPSHSSSLVSGHQTTITSLFSGFWFLGPLWTQISRKSPPLFLACRMSSKKAPHNFSVREVPQPTPATATGKATRESEVARCQNQNCTTRCSQRCKATQDSKLLSPARSYNHLTIHKLTFMSHQSSHIIPSHTSSLGNHVARRNEAEDARRAAADAHRQYCALASAPIIWPPALAEQQQQQLAFLWSQIDPQ